MTSGWLFAECEHTVDEVLNVFAVDRKFVVFHESVVKVRMQRARGSEQRSQSRVSKIFGKLFNGHDHRAMSAGFHAAPVHFGDYDMRGCTPKLL